MIAQKAAPYCLPCNRHHVPGTTPMCRQNRAWMLIGWFLFTMALLIIAMAAAGLSVGAWN